VFSATLEASVANLGRLMRSRLRLVIRFHPQARDMCGQDLKCRGPQTGLACSIFACKETGRCLIFARTKAGPTSWHSNLNREGFARRCELIHGDRWQSQRTRPLTGSQQGRYRILVLRPIVAGARGILRAGTIAPRHQIRSAGNAENSSPAGPETGGRGQERSAFPLTAANNVRPASARAPCIRMERVRQMHESPRSRIEREPKTKNHCATIPVASASGPISGMVSLPGENHGSSIRELSYIQ